MNGEDYEAARPVPARSRVTGDPWVRGHLPECEWNDDTRVNRHCICPALRDCEARVRHEGLGVCIEHYDAGVAAARQALAAFPGRAIMDDSSYIHRADALAAIDALNGEQA